MPIKIGFFSVQEFIIFFIFDESILDRLLVE